MPLIVQVVLPIETLMPLDASVALKKSKMLLFEIVTPLLHRATVVLVPAA